jgi:hypothetical protein
MPLTVPGCSSALSYAAVVAGSANPLVLLLQELLPPLLLLLTPSAHKHLQLQAPRVAEHQPQSAPL